MQDTTYVSLPKDVYDRILKDLTEIETMTVDENGPSYAMGKCKGIALFAQIALKCHVIMQNEAG